MLHRGGGAVAYPARFQLVLAANPCPCGQRARRVRLRAGGAAAVPAAAVRPAARPDRPAHRRRAGAARRTGRPGRGRARRARRWPARVAAARAAAAERWAGHEVAAQRRGARARCCARGRGACRATVLAPAESYLVPRRAERARLRPGAAVGVDARRSRRPHRAGRRRRRRGAVLPHRTEPEAWAA